MAYSVTMVRNAAGEDGTVWRSGLTYPVRNEQFANALIERGDAYVEGIPELGISETVKARALVSSVTIDNDGLPNLSAYLVPRVATDSQLLGSVAGEVDEFAVSSDSSVPYRLTGLAGGGRPLQPFIPCAWASRPDATTWSGRIIRVTDYRNSLWISDGSVWRPLNGEAVLWTDVAAAKASAIVSLAGNGGVRWFAMPTQLAIPAGMLQPGFALKVRYAARKVGAEGSDFYINIGSAPNAGTGTSGSMLTTDFASVNPQPNIGTGVALIRAGGFYGHIYTSPQGSPQKLDDYMLTEATDANIATQARYVNFGIGAGFSASSTISILSYRISIEG